MDQQALVLSRRGDSHQRIASAAIADRSENRHGDQTVILGDLLTHDPPATPNRATSDGLRPMSRGFCGSPLGMTETEQFERFTVPQLSDRSRFNKRTFAVIVRQRLNSADSGRLPVAPALDQRTVTDL